MTTTENLDKDIANYLQSKDVVELFIKIFERLEHDYRKNLAKEILSLIYVSRDGLSEDNLMEIINQNSTHKLTRLEFSPLFLAVENHLINRGGLYGFFHDYIGGAVESRYLSSEEFVNDERRKIADYFEDREIDNQRVRELPFQLFELEDRDRLYQNLVKIDFFFRLVDDADLEYETLKYIQFVDEKYDMSKDMLPMLLKSDNIYKISRITLFLSGIYGKYDEALPLFEKSLEMQIDIFGEEHIKTSQSYHNLATFYCNISQYDEALNLHKKAIKIRKSILGEEHISIMESYVELANLYGLIGKHNEALLLLKKTINIGINSLNMKEIDIIRVYQQLLINYIEINNSNKALFFAKKILNFKGLNNIILANVYNSMSSIYIQMEKYEKAKKYSIKALSLTKKVVGKNHHSLSGIYNNLGNVYELQYQYNKALTYHKKSLSLSISIRNGAEKHSETATIYNNIANIYQLTNRHKDSLVFLEKALEIRIKVFDLNHSVTADTYNNIAFVNQNIGEYEKAIFFYLKDLEISEKETPHNSQLIDTYRNISQCYQELHNYQEALFYSKKCLEIEEETLGMEHINTIITYYNIGQYSFLLGKYSDTILYLTNYYNLSNKQQLDLEEENKHASNTLGISYFKIENYTEANKYYLKALKLAKESHDDELITSSYNNLAKLCVAQKKYQEALPLYKKAIEMIRESNNPNPKVYINYADFLTKIKDLNSAKKNYLKAIKIIESRSDNHPDFIEAKNSLEKVNKKLNSL